MGPEALKAIHEAADYCAKLAAVEHAHIVGDSENLDTLLSGVDLIDARLTANKLYAIHALWSAVQDRGGSSAPHATDAAGDAAVPLSVAPPAHKTPAAHDGESEQATAPTIYPQVTHIGDNWSRKAPCA